jgi:cysteinyl-tRNA synthetase
MTIKLHNTLTKTVNQLEPLTPGHVSIYSCGPTVYDHVHIGNLSAFIVADTLRRAISAHDLQIKHVMNFTDVDDKTIRRSREKYPDLDPMDALKKLTKEYSALFLEDMKLVGNDITALTFIHAADDTTINGMRGLISELYQNGFAYIADDGIYFSIDAYRKSGKVYGQLVEITEANTGSERIQNDEYDKESVHDFALWKVKKTGEPSWGFTLDGHDLSGRPGWHIECSVMSRLELGQPFDIHTGGIDLAFPHHENEIAQSTAGHNDPMYADIFVHNEHILVDGKKMSKSANNFYTLSDLIGKGVDPLAFRLLVLQSHYRKPTNFSLENAEAAQSRLQHWRSVAALRWQTVSEGSAELDDTIRQSTFDLIKFLDDDLNTPEALRVVDEVFTKLENHPLSQISKKDLINLVLTIDKLLGVGLANSTPDIDNEAKELITKRLAARQNHDWAASDKLRLELADRHITTRDTPEGTVWSYAG